MPSNDRPVARPTARKSSSSMSANTTRDQSIRDTQYDDEFLMGEDDPASNPPRPHSSAIRLNPPQAPRRVSRDVHTDTQTTRRPSPNNIPPRSTQKQFPVQPTGAIPAARPARNVNTAYTSPPAPNKRERRNVHWLLYVGMGMLIALILWLLGMNAVTWGTNEYNNLVYGYPRTFQTDAVVGHNDSAANPSHFIAVNLHGQIIVVEFPGGNPSKAIDYAGPDLIEPGEDLLPVTLTFSDLNHDGKPDMIIHVADKIFVFYNNGSSFATNSATPGPTATP